MISWISRLACCLPLAVALAGASAQAAEPFTFGMSISQTGGLAPGARAVLLGMQIWIEDTNAKGGLLGRPVKLLTYDDQSNPALVPGIVAKLLDVDKVDFLLGGQGTNLIAPLMPAAMQRNLTVIGMFGLDVNSEFHYPNYFSIIPTGGAHPKEALAEPFFEVAMTMDPKPRTAALVGADTEFSRNAVDGARTLAQRAGLKIVYDKSYPPTTQDFAPIIHAIQATSPDLVYVGSYPTDTVGIIRAVNEVGLHVKMFGGGMVGSQLGSFKSQLGPMLNGLVNYDLWLPVGAYATPEALAFIAKYQSRVAGSGADMLGYYQPPFAYADLQVIGEAIRETGGTDQAKLADYLRSHTFHTLVGDIKFGPNGEWSEPRVLEVQFHDVKGHDLDQFRTMGTQTVLYPPALKTGTVKYPYSGGGQ
jgi:branched-chain amino acid transport system substrate-binding protein